MACEPTVADRLFDEVSPSIIERLDEFYEKGATFRDPVNSVQNLDRIAEMYRDLFKNLKNIRMEVTDRSQGEHNHYYRWRMSYTFRNKPREIDGVSEIRFGATGLIAAQTDFWDASHCVYGEFPGIGLILRGIHRLVRIK